MKTVSSFLLFLFMTPLIACELNTEIISLSGPITMLLEELDLTQDKKLLAVSQYHPVKNKKLKQLPGGLFIGTKTLRSFSKKTTVIFDQSFELKKSLSHYFSERLIELDSRGVDPFVVYKRSIKILTPLISGCDTKMKKLDRVVRSVKETKFKFNNKVYLYYLGELKKSGKKPELLMVNDGPIKWLKDQLKLKTYPSSLAYVTWSQKILNSISNPVEVGLLDSKEDELVIEKISFTKYNIHFRGLLIPGIRQIFFIKEYLNYLK